MRCCRAPARLGVWLDSDDDPALIAGDLEHFGVVAVNFPHFTDGRGYSIGRLLRERYGWRGELRADRRRAARPVCSICRAAASMRLSCARTRMLQAALAAFGDFSEAYQTSVERPLPLFRRRFTASPDGIEWS